MFGRGRSQNGIILDLHPDHAFDPNDLSKLAEFRAAIRCVQVARGAIQELGGYSLPYHCLIQRPLVKKANAHSPSHSRLVDDVSFVIQ
jgi:hypothetical protein